MRGTGISTVCSTLNSARAYPNPEPGLVVSYAYLWHREHRMGQDEGRKYRPSVIVLANQREHHGANIVTVLPITHSPPSDPDTAVEIPQPVKRHLGLDGDPSWIVVAEGNEFLWPGYDLRKIPDSDNYDYGFLPPRFFDQVVKAFAAWHRTKKQRLTSRDK